MARKHITLAFATLLASAPLASASLAAAQSAPPDRATTTAPAESTKLRGSGEGNTVAPVPNVESSSPATPMPMSLPDNANANEVKSQYGIGVAGLIIGTVLLATLVVGILYIISVRSWSTSH